MGARCCGSVVPVESLALHSLPVWLWVSPCLCQGLGSHFEQVVGGPHHLSKDSAITIHVQRLYILNSFPTSFLSSGPLAIACSHSCLPWPSLQSNTAFPHPSLLSLLTLQPLHSGCLCMGPTFGLECSSPEVRETRSLPSNLA